jgi:hypothetical protein
MARLLLDDRAELERLDGERTEGEEVRLRDTGQIVIYSQGRWLDKPMTVNELPVDIQSTPVYAAPLGDAGDLDVDEALVDHHRHCMEVAVGLLRQGQDTAALDVLANALAGVFHPEVVAPPDDAPLELAVEDETPEIPEFRVDANWELTIDDEGWEIDLEVIDRISHEVVIGRDAEHLTIYWAENKVRLMLQSGVMAGRVRKL